jgi:hypothetical protein
LIPTRFAIARQDARKHADGKPTPPLQGEVKRCGERQFK